jgi:hypothetical protein
VRGTRDLHWLVPQSVYQRVLGDEFDRLAPELRAYFSAPPADSVGRGHGVYEVAGSHKRWLAPLFAFLAWRRILFPELGYGVPFTVTNIPGPGEGLSSRREFHLPGRERQMHDTMHVVDGSLHDFLGRRGGLEVRLRPTVGDDGSLRMLSDRAWLHLRALRVPRAALRARAARRELGRRSPAGRRADAASAFRRDLPLRRRLRLPLRDAGLMTHGPPREAGHAFGSGGTLTARP